jgi:hypothetical protein
MEIRRELMELLHPLYDDFHNKFWKYCDNLNVFIIKVFEGLKEAYIWDNPNISPVT